MTDTILAFFAFAVLVAFLGILVFYVPRLDLGLVVGATLLLAAYDFFWHGRKHSRKNDQ